jgi:hypothetical protein
MAIMLACGGCAKRYRVPEDKAGKKVKCPGCGSVLEVPHVPGPEATWTDHGGQPVQGDANFFAPPPPAIGTVLSAWTTLRKGKKPLSGVVLALLILTAVGVEAAGVVAGLTLTDQPGPRTLCIMAGLPVLGLVVIFALAGYCKHCTYVGDQGVARFQLYGRSDRPQEEVMLFRDARELRVLLEEWFQNGLYSKTNYTYEWKDAQGKGCFRVAGAHTARKELPVSTDPYRFARAAEAAWTAYLLPRARALLERGRTVRFPLTRGRWLGIRKGALVLCTGKEEEAWVADELEALDVAQDTASFRLRGVRRGLIFNSAGEFKFQTSKMANTQLFFVLVAEELGLELQDVGFPIL